MKRRRLRQRGYTAVEVLAALMLFAIGAAGVIGMEKVTIQGGSDAHHYDIATGIAHEWVARLQRDATTWTQPNATIPTSNLSSATTWLKDVATCNTANFCASSLGLPGYSQAFDIQGRDINDKTEGYFCVQYRMGWVSNPETSPYSPTDEGPTALIRADIRVVWNRLEYGPIADCTTVPTTGTLSTQYHVIYVTAAIRQNAKNN